MKTLLMNKLNKDCYLNAFLAYVFQIDIYSDYMYGMFGGIEIIVSKL